MIRIRGLSFEYGDGKKALDGIDLRIEQGEFVLLTGPSGSGKTSLVRCLNGLIPNFYGGRLNGSVIVDGREATRTPTREMARTVGMVFQDPEDMFISSDVEGEIEFSAANLGGEVSDRVLDNLGIGHLRKRSLHSLSGGEKQRVAISSILVNKPSVLVLDEPLSELDRDSADGLMGTLKGLNDRGTTIILIEQRTERVYRYATREIIMENGKIAYDGEPKRDGEGPKTCSVKPGKRLVGLEKVSFSFGRNRVLRDFSAGFRGGELVVLQGPNGSGKTTLLKLIMGLLKPDSGLVTVDGRESQTVEQNAGEIGYVFQNPNNHLFAETVGEEVEFILKNTGREGDVDGMLREFGVLRYKNDYPRYLSGGERQRVALASILVAGPRILLLDEPTRGMDRGLKRELGEYLLHYVGQGNLVIMATHDDFMASFATRRLEL
jgi:energy-coupling factor transport system ATP-binding protein